MIRTSLLEWIRRLLAEGKSQRQIQKITEANRRTIAKIANGQYPDYEARRRAKEQEEIRHLGPVERCPGCGARTIMPCRACLTRNHKERLPRFLAKERPDNRDDPLGLDLPESCHARYEAVHDRRKQLGEDYDQSESHQRKETRR